MARGWLTLAIIADGLHRAAFHRFPALGELFGVFRLLEYVRVAFVFRAGEIVRRCLAAQVTIDALAVHVELAGHVFHIFVFAVSHDEKEELQPFDAFTGLVMQLEFSGNHFTMGGSRRCTRRFRELFLMQTHPAFALAKSMSPIYGLNQQLS
jgi:hypothetical protein